jgi:hypothetical protein
VTEIAKREPVPVEGRIMTPGTAYLGRFAAYEAPMDAAIAHCPLSWDCSWKQYWDTREEARQAEDCHALEAHGGGDDVARRQHEKFWSNVEQLAGLPTDVVVAMAERLKAEGKI